MNWGLGRRAPQLKLATCNFPNAADLRLITVLQWCTNALRAVSNWQATLQSYSFTALIVMQTPCKLSGSLRCCHLLQLVPQTCRKNSFSIRQNRFALILIRAEHCVFFIGSIFFLKKIYIYILIYSYYLMISLLRSWLGLNYFMCGLLSTGEKRPLGPIGYIPTDDLVVER